MTTKGFGDITDLPQKRLYEMCMVFKYKTSIDVAYEEPNNEMYTALALRKPDEKEEDQMQKWKMQRESIMKSLQNCGMDLYCFFNRDRNEVFVKIGASSQKLRDTAARKRYKIQLKKEYLNAYAEFRNDHPGRPEFQFKDRRIISHIYKTHMEDNLDGASIFKTIDKIYLVDHIIQSKDKDCAGINVGKLLHTGEIKAYFPLHEDLAKQELQDSQMQWFLMGEDFATKFRDYFGDKVCYYFLWMSFYMKWLAPLAVIGVALQLIDWMARTPDNITAVPFCILMSLWSVLLPYFWRRQEAKYAVSWGTLDLVDQLEPARPEHTGENLINPVTSQVEPYFPARQRLWMYVISSGCMSLAAALVIFTILILLFMRHTMKFTASGGIVGFQFGLAVWTEICNNLLSRLARFLTEQENHRTEKDHDTAQLVKVMLIKFISSFYALYYIAFFKSHEYLFGDPMTCLRNDCFLDLQAQLGMFVIFRLVVMNLFEHYWPKIRFWLMTCWENRQNFRAWRQRFLHGQGIKELTEMSPTEMQARRAKYGNFENFDEVLIMHGYATIFAVSSPWVTAATFIAIVVEIWVDMRSLLVDRQRPMPFHAKNNEPWTTAFEVYGIVAAFTNMFLLIFASGLYVSYTFTEKLVLFCFLEHLIFGARMLTAMLFPIVPLNVQILQLKQDNVVHRCLEGIKVEQNMDFSMFRKHDATGEIQVFDYDKLEEMDEEEGAADPELSLKASGESMLKGLQAEANSHTGTLNTVRDAFGGFCGPSPTS